MSDSREPPADEAAELAVIATTLLSADQVLPLLAWLPVDDFFWPHHREAWAAILATFERRMPVDVVSVGDELKSRGMQPRFPGGWQAWALQAAAKTVAPQHVEAHAEIVRDKASLRRLIALATEVASTAYGSQPVEEVMALARHGVAALELRAGDKESVRIGDALSGVLEVIEDRARGKIPSGIRYGISTLDDILGSAKPGQFILVAARPGEGKSALVDQVMAQAARAGYPAHMFSLEMLVQELTERSLSAVSGVPSYKMANGRLVDDDWAEIQNGGEKLRPIPLWIDDKSRTIAQIAAKLRKWRATESRATNTNGKPPMAIAAVDYLQRVVADVRKGETRDLELGRIGRELKSLAMELQIPIIAVAALSRAVEKRGGRPVLSDLRECGTLEYDADVVIFVYRDIPAEDQKRRRESGAGELIVAKHRGGPTGVADVWWVSELTAWRSIDSYSSEPPPRNHTETERRDDF